MSNEAFREMAVAMRSHTGFDARMISFRKGAWSTGKDGADMNGAELIALVSDLMLGWTKWSDRKPVEYRVGFVRDRYQPARRGDLGDNDSSNWERRNDPWEFSFFLPLVEAGTGQAYIYSTGTQGGKNCLADLQEAYADRGDGKQPVVTLSGDRYDHHTYGEVETPHLTILRWVDPPGVTIKPPATAAIARPASATPLIEHRAAKTTPIDDDIPF